MVGGILEAAGIKGFMGNREKLNALVKTDDPITGLMDALIAEHQATYAEFRGTLFKVGKTDISLPKPLRGQRLVSIGDVLTGAQLPVNGFGYKQDADGVIFYPTSANNAISQRISGLVGTVREGEGETVGRWILQAVPDVPRSIGKLYRLEHILSSDPALPKPRRKRRQGKF